MRNTRYPQYPTMDRPKETMITLHECGGAGMCGWLSLNRVLRENGIETDVRQLVASKLQKLPPNIVLTALRGMAFEPKVDLNAAKFVFGSTDPAALFVKTARLDDDEMIQKAGSDAPFALYKASLCFDTTEVCAWMINYLLRSPPWFDHYWGLLVDACLPDMHLIVLNRPQKELYCTSFKGFSPDAKCIFLFNTGNAHFCAAQVNGAWSLRASEFWHLYCSRKSPREDDPPQSAAPATVLSPRGNSARSVPHTQA